MALPEGTGGSTRMPYRQLSGQKIVTVADLAKGGPGQNRPVRARIQQTGANRQLVPWQNEGKPSCPCTCGAPIDRGGDLNRAPFWALVGVVRTPGSVGPNWASLRRQSGY